ncbi:hypothetical protein STRAU_5963 [Streptomyces aurantiacus JA 4570]|uniref:Uncharacterized protein n=1 Tax=Streptomyces aurantiacus JA 4570 TaxID=1286094 RepID=S4AHP1_9ACTN|nr:hypothetical protein STRAU_5963 [Streptomyces aurantiacus JA 4570]
MGPRGRGVVEGGCHSVLSAHGAQSGRGCMAVPARRRRRWWRRPRQ